MAWMLSPHEGSQLQGWRGLALLPGPSPIRLSDFLPVSLVPTLASTQRNPGPAQATTIREALIKEAFADLLGDSLPPYPRSIHHPLVFYTAHNME